MAFCNSCGATLSDGTKFCSKCGTPVPVGAPVTAAATAPVTTPPPAKGGSSALKIVLIVVAAIVLIGIIGVAAVGIIGYRIAKSSHINREGDNVKVETPFGTVESSKDPAEAARQIGIDIYPGAQIQKEGASSASLGGIRTVNAMFESSDSVEKVCSFYKSKFPNANVSTSDQDRCTIVSNSPPNIVTINVESSGEGSKFQVSSVNKRAGSSNQ